MSFVALFLHQGRVTLKIKSVAGNQTVRFFSKIILVSFSADPDVKYLKWDYYLGRGRQSLEISIIHISVTRVGFINPLLIHTHGDQSSAGSICFVHLEQISVTKRVTIATHDSRDVTKFVYLRSKS